MRFVVLALIGAPSLVALACSSSHPSAVEAFAQQYCASFTPCCGADAGDTSTGACESTVTSWSKSIGFDPSLTSACLTALNQAAGTVDFCTDLGPAGGPCGAVFAAVPSSGTVQPGGACTRYDDCASTSGAVATCDFPVGASVGATGTCKVVLRGLAGDAPCTREEYGGATMMEGSGTLPEKSYACHDFDGVFCDFATSTCEPFLAIGQPCDINGDDCGLYATCSGAAENPDGGVISTCASLEAGAPCDPGPVSTDDPTCDLRTSRCRASSNTCVPFLTSGSACASDDECQGACRGGVCATVAEAQLCDTSSPSFRPAWVPARLRPAQRAR